MEAGANLFGLRLCHHVLRRRYLPATPLPMTHTVLRIFVKQSASKSAMRKPTRIAA